ncbi:MAG TPA: amidohydrolase family protein [Sphingobium sp.]
MGSFNRSRRRFLYESGLLAAMPLSAGWVAASARTLAATKGEHDLHLVNGIIVDGDGRPGYRGEVAISDDRIVAVGPRVPGTAREVLDVGGQVIAPGFINMLSWANESLIADGRAQSDLRQGVTLEVMGEGWSMGPYSDQTRQTAVDFQTDIRYPITWNSLDGYLSMLERKGLGVNVASFIGATTVREVVLGYGDIQPTPEQLDAMDAMVALVDQAMRDGALGVASAIPYAPGSYAHAPELVALARAAGRHSGIYATHIRSESEMLLEAIDEAIDVNRQTQTPVHIYHLKAAGVDYKDKFPAAVARIEKARSAGQRISADIYSYTSAWAALTIAIPPWAQAGGLDAFIERMKDQAQRARVVAEIGARRAGWENFYQLAGASGTLLVAFKSLTLQHLAGKTLAQVAELRGTSPVDMLIDLVIEDRSPVSTIFFLTDEEQVREKMQIPWLAFGSDAGAPSAEGVFLGTLTHPRSYGNFSRVLEHYVGTEKLLSLEQAIHRMTALPASILKLPDRGRLQPGYHADIVVFDPTKIQTHATYEHPHAYSTGVSQVWVNGVHVLENGEPTGAHGGRVVRGRGWTKGDRHDGNIGYDIPSASSGWPGAI